MKDLLQKINELSKKRIKSFKNNDENSFYKWPKTYIDAIRLELEESNDEFRENNSVYLEDELWDVLWTYMCLLNSLEKDWYITDVEKVFERSFKKYSWRINVDTWINNWKWSDTKKIQKRELDKEHLLSQQKKFW